MSEQPKETQPNNNDVKTIREQQREIILVEVVMRQTDYDRETATNKLREHNHDVTKTVREYMGVSLEPPLEVKRSTNQMVYGEFRNLMDNAAASYRAKKELEERRQAYITSLQRQRQEAKKSLEKKIN